MADSRETAWLRDELVLVLDLYVRQGKRPAREVRQALDDALRSFRRELEPTVDGPRLLERKLLEFAGLDPEDATADHLALDAPERAIWTEFANDRARLRSEAKMLRPRVYDVVAFLRARTEPIEDPVDRPAVPRRRVHTRQRDLQSGHGCHCRAARDSGRSPRPSLSGLGGVRGGSRSAVLARARTLRERSRCGDRWAALFADGMYNGVAGKVGSSLAQTLLLASQANLSEPPPGGRWWRSAARRGWAGLCLC